MLEKSAFDNSEHSFCVKNVSTIGNGALKIELSDARVVYTRAQYLDVEISPGQIFFDEFLEKLCMASRIYLAECQAVNILNYSENTRFMLETKLIKKGFSKQEFSPALNYLEARQFLSDERFANIWVRNRLRFKLEGKSVLQAKLMAKGVEFETAKEVVLKHFETVDENELCKKALKKQLQKCKDKEKVFARVLRRGFSYATVKRAWNNIFDKSIDKL